MTSFIHLHCHSEYSVARGLLQVKTLVNQVKKLKMPAVAVTDCSNVFSMVKFYQAAMAAGIKPIIGAKIGVENQKQANQPFQFILLCQNQVGYLNLAKILSQSYLTEQDNQQPYVTQAFLHKHHQGLLLIACPLESDVAQAVKDAQLDLAETLMEYWSGIFPCRFYLAVSRTNREHEEEVTKQLVQLATKKQIPLVASNEVCFLNQDDFEAHEARVCIHQGALLGDATRRSGYSSEQYLKSPQQMAALFADLPDAISNTVEIAKRCNLQLKLGEVHLPQFPVPEGLTTESYLRQAAHHGLQERMPGLKDQSIGKRYFERLDIELDVINNMGFAGYFLIVSDFIQWAERQDIPVGPGRGSGAGSLVAYALHITGLDPLKYDLLFERFLNPERVSMPDFDIDFCMEGRDRVIEYVAETYGREAVSQIITYGTMAAKAVVRDVGRVLGMSYGFVDKIAKLVPNELGITLDKALAQEENLKQRYKEEEEVKTLIDLAKKLEGVVRNVGKHAGGVVIAPSKLTDFTPLYLESHDGQAVTQFDKNDVESIGLVKFDFLGLRTLTIIKWALDAINAKRQATNQSLINIQHIDLHDEKTFELLQRCDTTAVFQLESRGMKDLIRRLKPDCFEDIVALVALFRPGPLQSGMVDDFIDRKLGKAEIAYPHPDLEPILRETYGVILYQEQVMQIAQTLAGYTLGAADLLRRAMGKKKPEEMAKQRSIFTEGATARGIEDKTATYIFDLMEKFAGYGFNKSHSAAYALVSYQTAWLKAHYPADFMAAVLSSDLANTDKIVVMIEDCRKLGIKVIPPDINQGGYKFSATDEKSIVYGLGAIKGVGEAAIMHLTKDRSKHGPFVDVYDLCARADSHKLTKRTLEAFVQSGALDKLGNHRAELMGLLPSAVKAAEQWQQNRTQGQDDLFGQSSEAIQLPQQTISISKWTTQKRLAAEKASLGLYLTGHPISEFEQELQAITTCRLGQINSALKTATIAGFVVGMRTMQTKRGDRMAFLSLDDRTARLEVAIFSDLFKKHRELIKKDIILFVKGDISVDEYSGGFRIRATDLMDLETARTQQAKGLQIQLKQLPEADFANKLRQLLQPYRPGLCPVEILSPMPNKLQARLNLGRKWCVRPAPELVETMHTEFEDVTISINY